MEVKSIRERIEWDASSQEVEFRNVDYVNKFGKTALHFFIEKKLEK